MIRGKSILGIIPARGGSKGLPKKNIKMMCGKPLIFWTIDQALASEYVDEVFLSTDSEEIAEVSKRTGLNVPFLRPPELARDDSPTADAIEHVLTELQKNGKRFDYLVLLEPTSPLRRPEDIDAAIRIMDRKKDADCLISVGEIHMEHPMIAKAIDKNGFVAPYIHGLEKINQRQQADKAYFPYGVIYISKVSSFMEKRTFYTEKTIPYFIERWQNFEVDDEIDFDIIEYLMMKKNEVRYG